MERLRIIPEDKSLLQLQKLCIAKGILPEISLPKAVKVFISDSVFYLCQIFHKSDMHHDFCTVDFSVVCHKVNESCEEILPPLMGNNVDYLSLSNIVIIPKINIIKSLSVTIILESPELVSFWKGNSIVKDILKMFLLTGKSYVFLDSVQMLQSFGIYCLFVHNIGNIEVGRITSNAKVKVVKVMSRLRFEQLYQSSKTINHLSGLGKHSLLLTEIIQNTKKNLENHVKSNDFHHSHQVIKRISQSCSYCKLFPIYVHRSKHV